MLTFIKRCSLAAALVTVSLAPIAAYAQAAPAKAPAFFYRDGDRPIVFLGDSITDQKIYTTYIETYILSRFPHWNVSFRNIGWGGDTAGLGARGGIDHSFARDVLSLHPAAITIDFGMNDARGGDNAYPDYVANQAKLTEGLKAAGARVVLITPSPEERYEAGQPAGSAYNLMLGKYSDGLKQIAAKEGVPFIDQRTPFIKVIEDGRAAGILGTAGDPRLTYEGVHPNAGGHLVMAAAILKGMNAPALVSEVDIDGATRKITRRQNCTATSVNTPAGQRSTDIVFTRLDNALPWYAPPDANTVLKIPGFTPFDDLSRFMLRVTRLPMSSFAITSYTLKEDGVQAGIFSSSQLAAGVNLTGLPGPITDQAAKLMHAVIDKNALWVQRWRNVQIYDAPPWLDTAMVETNRAAEVAKLDKQVADSEAAINLLRQPVIHTWTLSLTQ